MHIREFYDDIGNLTGGISCDQDRVLKKMRKKFYICGKETEEGEGPDIGMQRWTHSREDSLRIRYPKVFREWILRWKLQERCRM